MGNIKQVQKAGDGSSVAQIGMINNYGIDEKRVREICDEKIQYAIHDLTSEACTKATQKVYDFITLLLAKISERKMDLSAFAEPSFQRELIKAQTFSAVSDRKTDVEMLSELLLARMNGKLKRKTKTGISRAMEVVAELDDDELLGLTVVFLVLSISPTAQLGAESRLGLDAIERVFSKFPLDELPNVTAWIENLNILDAVIISPFGGFSKFHDILESKMSGYVCVGIGKDAPELLKAKSLLRTALLSDSVLCENEFLEGYYRLPVVNISDVRTLSLHKMFQDSSTGKIINIPVPMTEDVIRTLSDISALYNKDAKLMSEVKQKFEAKLKAYPTLYKVQQWFDNLKMSFNITKVGKALAYVNGKRYAPELPELSLE